MQNVWIYQRDKKTYMDVMNIECGSPEILQETDDKLLVNFCHAAMQLWVQSGHWFEAT